MARLVAERHDVVPELAEIFREYGYEGTSLSVITDRTGLGKGSLYHFFPGGKAEMAEAVLADIADWFEANVFQPLREDRTPEDGVKTMFHAVDAYFGSGRRICLVGAFALDNTRERFADAVHGYFHEWALALALALHRAGLSRPAARAQAENALIRIQGALLVARAQDDPAVFTRATKALRRELLDAMGSAQTGGA